MIRYICCLTAALAISVSSASADVVFSNDLTTGTQIDPGKSRPYVGMQFLASNVTSPGITYGGGLIGYGGNNTYLVGGFESTFIQYNSDYFSFSMTPINSATIDFSSFAFTASASGSIPTDVSLQSSADGFGSGRTTFSGLNGSGDSVDLSAAEFQGISGPIEFRLYGLNGNVWGINSFQFDGTVTAVPEPSSALALIGVAGAVIGYRVRRKRSAV